MMPSRLRMSSRRCIFVALAGVACLLGCILDHGTGAVAGGGSSETTNGTVVGFVRNPDGSAAATARVSLRPRDFLKDTLTVTGTLRREAEAVTDARGRYVIDSVLPGDYFIEANIRDTLGTLRDFSAGDRDTIFLDSLWLKPTGVVVGQLTSDPKGIPGAYIQVYGLDRVARADSNGAFLIPNLPEGSYTLHASLPSGGLESRDIAGVAARGADTNDIGTVRISSFEDEDYATWPYARRITLNTTASGAGVAGSVAGFPLLVRLNSANFDFALSAGMDIRFSGKDGKHLRYQIERWDAATQQAELWVKLDTIHGNSHSDYITLHFGKPGAPDWSDAGHVFDSADGFGGVWHLAEEAADTATKGLYRDASPAAQNGDDRIVAKDTSGIIGLGHGFGLGDYIKMQPSATLRPQNQIQISAWYRGKATANLGSTITSLGDAYGLRVEPSGNVRMFVFTGTAGIWSLVMTKTVNVLDSSWHHLAGSFDGKELKVYVDGTMMASAVAKTAAIPYTLGPDFYIGRHGTSKRDYDFTGSLDEVVVLRGVRNADWVRLNFESQRVNPTLLEY